MMIDDDSPWILMLGMLWDTLDRMNVIESNRTGPDRTNRRTVKGPPAGVDEWMIVGA